MQCTCKLIMTVRHMHNYAGGTQSLVYTRCTCKLMTCSHGGDTKLGVYQVYMQAYDMQSWGGHKAGVYQVYMQAYDMQSWGGHKAWCLLVYSL